MIMAYCLVVIQDDRGRLKAEMEKRLEEKDTEINRLQKKLQTLRVFMNFWLWSPTPPKTQPMIRDNLHAMQSHNYAC